MAGISKLLTNIRGEVANFRQQTRKRFGEMQSQLDDLQVRLDKLDLPAQTQTGAPARKAAAKAPKKAAGKAKTGSRARRPVPVPDRPEVMQEAGVGTDPR